jgi:alkylated DNA repair dioxygenase AlkB
VEASGDLIAGVCLGSDAVMILRNVDDPSLIVTTLLPRGCLYFQRGDIRYKWSHEIPESRSPLNQFDSVQVEREQRIAILLRNAKP